MSIPHRGRDPKVEVREIDSLYLHPGHAVFTPPKDHEIAELAADIEDRGLQHPIEITPGSAIITGQKRWLAMQWLGHTTICCRVREDLVAQGEDAVFEHLLADNLRRRNLSKLERARALATLYASTPRRRKGQGELREDMGRAFGECGRTISRWLRALTTPREIQEALERNELTLCEVNRIAGLSKAQQAKIIADMQAGRSPKEALASALGKPPRKPSKHKAQPNTMGELATAAGRYIKEANEQGIKNSKHAAMLQHIVTRLQSLIDNRTA
jgi:ParB/RepB/Spo0J family partition protein